MPPIPEPKPPLLRHLRNIRLALQEVNLIAVLIVSLLSILGIKWLT
ncbi:MAG: hypothetical protein MUF11_13065 [Beijerinckiaceae bacterium]|jgi:hypothetical protein|nr:hypothetical protein [Beijerinckiaceae bacterium]